MIFDNIEAYRSAFQLWQEEHRQFEAAESKRLASLEKRFATRDINRPVVLLVFAFVIAMAAGTLCHDGGITLLLIMVQVFPLPWLAGAFGRLERWRARDELVRRPFGTPQPVYQPRANSSPPPRGEQTRSAPPPRSTEAPPRPEPTGEIRITSLQQAFGVLELTPGRTTLSAAKAAYRARMVEYHPDKVSHLGPELRELAARKALQFNLALQYLKEHTH